MESSINTPHVDADAADAEDFFSGEMTQAEKEAAEGAAYREGHGEPEPAPGSMQTAEQTAAARAAREEAWERGNEEARDAEEEASEEAVVAEEEEWGDEDASAEAEDLPIGELADAASAWLPEGDLDTDLPEPVASEVASGKAAREYTVFKTVPLTEKVLRGLLASIAAGVKPEVALIELGRVIARTDKQAVGEVYLANAKELGARCTLASVSSSRLKERKIAPEPVPVEKRIKIT